jgi:hypothetical protein
MSMIRESVQRFSLGLDPRDHAQSYEVTNIYMI